MLRIITVRINTLLIVTALFSLTSCSNDDSIENLDETFFVRHENADMPAYVHGNATEKIFLIVLNGGPGGFGLTYRTKTFIDTIEKEYAVVYFDQRGSGVSQGKYSEKEVTVDLMAGDVIALAKVIKEKYGDDSRIVLMGHSWGGTLGTATILKDQNEFLGWIEVDGVHDPKGMYLEYITNHAKIANEQIALGNSLDYWETVLQLVDSVSPTYNEENFFDLNSEAFTAEEQLAEDDIINEENWEDEIGVNYNVLMALWNSGQILKILTNNGLWEDISFTDRLSEITIPSLIITGQHDLIVPTKFAQEAFDNIGSEDKELLIFERSGHSPMASEKELFAAEILEFIGKIK